MRQNVQSLLSIMLLALGVSMPLQSTAHTHAETGVDFSIMKDKFGMSCCNDKDCEIYPDNVVDMSHYQEGYIRVKIRSGTITGNPKVYLESLVEPPRGVPDGHVVVCHSGLEVHCVALQMPATQ